MHETGLFIHQDLYRDARNKVTNAFIRAKRKYIQDTITSSDQCQKPLFRSVNELLNKTKNTISPSNKSVCVLPGALRTFFIEKVVNIQKNILESDVQNRGDVVVVKSCPPEVHLSFFEPATEDEVRELIQSSVQVMFPGCRTSLSH